MDYEKAYKEALGRAKKWYNAPNADKIPTYANRIIVEIFPELGESEDERIRKALIRFHKSTIDIDGIKGDRIVAWLEKQGESYTKKDVDDAYLKGICDAKHELDKQGTPAKLSEEEQNRFAKVVLTSCALSFIDFLDAHKYEGKMCVSNGECEDIENAFHNAMWDRLHRYYCKYIEKQGEQKPADKSATNKQEDEIEIPFDAKDSELQEATYYIPKGFHAEIDDDKVVIKKGEKSATWNVEDSSKVQRICKYLDEAKKYYADITEVRECMDWLKSLKDRIGG